VLIHGFLRSQSQRRNSPTQQPTINPAIAAAKAKVGPKASTTSIDWEVGGAPWYFVTTKSPVKPNTAHTSKDAIALPSDQRNKKKRGRSAFGS
jgi:hypothetical protein